MQEIAADHGGGNFKWTGKTEERNKMWQARHDAAYACASLKPGAGIMSTDVCVPISRLAECITETKKDIQENDLLAPIVGHVGDGNFHVVPLWDTEDAEETKAIDEFNDRLVMRALAMEGTCTGEHGIGLGKMKFLQAEHGDAVSLMRAIKLAIDPENLMNPGKIVSV